MCHPGEAPAVAKATNSCCTNKKHDCDFGYEIVDFHLKCSMPIQNDRMEEEGVVKSSVINQLNKQAHLITACRFHPLMEPVEQRI